jgi:hypothetical protein
MYCRRCDLEDVDECHECFIDIDNPVKPLVKRPDGKNKPSAKLIQRIKDDPYFEGMLEEPTFERLRPGKKQREWNSPILWTIVDSVNLVEIHSRYTVQECLKAKDFDVDGESGVFEIVPV